MKKTTKLAIFNTAFVLITILCLSKRALGLSFDLSNGTLKFTLSISITIFGIGMFFYIVKKHIVD